LDFWFNYLDLDPCIGEWLRIISFCNQTIYFIFSCMLLFHKENWYVLIVAIFLSEFYSWFKGGKMLGINFYLYLVFETLQKCSRSWKSTIYIREHINRGLLLWIDYNNFYGSSINGFSSVFTVLSVKYLTYQRILNLFSN